MELTPTCAPAGPQCRTGWLSALLLSWPGLARQAVRTLRGRPAQTKRCALKNDEVRDWRFEQDGQQSMLFSFTFGAGGRVLGSATGGDPHETADGGK